MILLLIAVLLLGVLVWAIRIKIPEVRQRDLDLASARLADVKEKSKVLNVEDKIVDEQLGHKKAEHKLNTKRKKL